MSMLTVKEKRGEVLKLRNLYTRLKHKCRQCVKAVIVKIPWPVYARKRPKTF